ncbi:uncharacterized protein LOC123306880 isoform X2 [Coccinella septempunctata]|uniref:uncharacterized protein LOC123306880 isoform X2 n=1 Tax=Coccinella septempunctata TaxID=41139 RepID=UPI001D08933D|nr:uncharacterized protein LOC123306880 isoform X2 [Coccinella septempunctata]
MTVNSQSGPRSPRPPDDLITTATSALRRLHFKTGRNTTRGSTKQDPTAVPKVVVMGSSTASETTINTSTDSSNTIVTTMTATDGDNTEDSLDITEPVDYLNSENILENPNFSNQILQPLPVTPKTPVTARQQTPPTAKNESTRFNFEVQSSFDTTQESESGDTPKGNVTPTMITSRNERKSENRADGDRKNVERLMEQQIEALKLEARRRNSYKAAQNDFDSIEMMESEDSSKRETKEHRRSFRRKLEVEGEERQRTSPKRRAEIPMHSSSENETDSPRPKHRHKKSSRRHQSPKQRDKFSYDEQQVAKYRDKARMTPPDLRIDFFTEPMDKCQGNGISNTLHAPASAEKRGSVCLNKCLREVGAKLDASTISPSPINVTTNPLDNSVHFGRKTPQATIVVQQPSLSLDHTNVSTILLKNGSDFVSNVENSGKFKKQREENMKQLLDVANNLTLEEIHDFEMRYGSPHHNRSQSVKTPGRSSGRPNYLCLPQQRSRVASMPNTGVEEEYYRLRHFSITGKGIVNRGDSLKSRRSRSNNSVASSNSSTEQLPGPTSTAGSARTSASCSLASSRESSTSAPGPTPYKVLMLGGPAVGKSSLVSQFMTSEYLHAYDTSIDDESGEKSVSVLLAGEESELTFIDFSTSDLSPGQCISKYTDPHAFCVVYSSADRSSLNCAENILQTLWTLDTISTKAVILVANKADLVRSKVVSTEEGKSIATAYDCKYIETSVGINHNVDELLVGILTQIRLKLENPERSRDLFRKRSNSKKNLNRNRSPASGTGTPVGSVQNSPKKYRGSRTSASLKVRSLLGKVWARDSKSKSCENLHVL